jgi:putative ABC transport system permease protein
VYATLSYGVAQRTREIGVRIALGAQRQSVVRLVLQQGAVLTLLGVAIGVAGAYALGRVFESLVYEVSVRDPRVLRASRVDPIVALREDG